MRAEQPTRSITRHRAGFTLLEVMIALSLLGFGLVVVIKSAAGNIFNAQQAHMMGVVTDLARGKMYDIEEKLLHDGFSDTEQHEDDQAFTEEGWPLIRYSYKIEVVELPSWENLQKIAQGQGSGSATGSAAGSRAGSGGGGGLGGLGSGLGSGLGDLGSAAAGGFENSALGGMLSQFSGFGLGGGAKSGAGAGSDISSSIGSAFVQSQYSMFQQILKVTIRKVTLTLKWQVSGSDRDMTVVQFLTDAASMDKVLNGLGSQDLPATGSGSGSSSGSGSGSGSGRTTTTTPGKS